MTNDENQKRDTQALILSKVEKYPERISRRIIGTAKKRTDGLCTLITYGYYGEPTFKEIKGKSVYTGITPTQFTQTIPFKRHCGDCDKVLSDTTINISWIHSYYCNWHKHLRTVTGVEHKIEKKFDLLEEFYCGDCRPNTNYTNPFALANTVEISESRRF